MAEFVVGFLVVKKIGEKQPSISKLHGESRCDDNVGDRASQFLLRGADHCVAALVGRCWSLPAGRSDPKNVEWQRWRVVGTEPPYHRPQRRLIVVWRNDVLVETHGI